MAISDMAARGSAKLARKAASMAASYNAAKGRMVANYQGVGFGPTRTSNYNAGVQAGQYRAPDPSKWARNWASKMSE